MGASVLACCTSIFCLCFFPYVFWPFSWSTYFCGWFLRCCTAGVSSHIRALDGYMLSTMQDKIIIPPLYFQSLITSCVGETMDLRFHIQMFSVSGVSSIFVSFRTCTNASCNIGNQNIVKIFLIRTNKHIMHRLQFLLLVYLINNFCYFLYQWKNSTWM